MKLLLQLKCMVIVVTHDTFGEYMNNFDKVYEVIQGTLKRVEVCYEGQDFEGNI